MSLMALRAVSSLICSASPVLHKKILFARKKEKKKKKHRAAQRICLDIEARPRWVTLTVTRGQMLFKCLGDCKRTKETTVATSTPSRSPQSNAAF